MLSEVGQETVKTRTLPHWSELRAGPALDKQEQYDHHY